MMGGNLNLARDSRIHLKILLHESKICNLAEVVTQSWQQEKLAVMESYFKHAIRPSAAKKRRQI